MILLTLKNPNMNSTFFFQYAHKEAVTYYNVTVRKVSRECIREDSFATKDTTITLFLSYSGYNISIRAFNRAGLSPAASIIIDDMDDYLQNTLGNTQVFVVVQTYSSMDDYRPIS